MSGHLTPTWGNRCHNKGRRVFLVIEERYGDMLNFVVYFFVCTFHIFQASHLLQMWQINAINANTKMSRKFRKVFCQVLQLTRTHFHIFRGLQPFRQVWRKKSIRTLGVADNLCCVRKWQGSQCVLSCLVQNWNPSLSSTTLSLHWEWVWRWLWVYKGKLIGRKFITKLRQTEVDSNSPQGVIEC